MARVVTDYLDEAVKVCPDKIAFEDDNRSATFSDVFFESKRIADEMRKRNIFHQPIVACMDPGVECISCIFGASYSHNMLTFINSEQSALKMGEVISTMKPALLLTKKSNEYLLEQFTDKYEIVLLEDMVNTEMSEADERDASHFDKGRYPASVVFTSGTTGVAKGVVLTHEQIINYVEMVISRCGFSEKTRLLEMNSNIFGFFILNAVCVCGAKAMERIVLPKVMITPYRLFNVIRECDLNAWISIASVFTLLDKFNAFANEELRKMRIVYFGGAKISNSTINSMQKGMPNARLISFFGATEALAAFYYEYFPDQDNIETPLGTVERDASVIILNDNYAPVSVGEIGEVYLGGGRVAAGYYRNKDLTRKSFVQNPMHEDYIDIVYRTGDFVKMENDGQMYFVGRKDSMVKRGGYRIELGEIEGVARRDKLVSDICCVFDEQREKIWLFYEGDIIESALMAILRGSLSSYMLPDQVKRLKELPRNDNSKIDINELKKRMEVL